VTCCQLFYLKDMVLLNACMYMWFTYFMI